MFFNIDADDGHAIRGWLVLDNPAAVPSITVVVPGRGEVTVESGLLRPDVRDLGVHVTGEVGFDINASQIPGIETLDDIALLESESRLLIFRRATSRHLAAKLYLFDAGIFPQKAMLANATGNFTNAYLSTERYSLETMLVLINNQFPQSIFLHGRSNFNRYSSFLSNAGFLRAALLRDPFEDLAERLVYLKLLAKMNPPQPLPDNLGDLKPLVGFAAELPLDDPKSILQAFRRLAPEQRHALANPMTRMLGCNFDELPQRRHVGIALENLASMTVVGSKEQFPLFRDLLAGILGRNIFGDATPYRFEAIEDLSRMLSQIGIVVDMLDCDLDLHLFATNAIRSALDTGAGIDRRDTQSI